MTPDEIQLRTKEFSLRILRLIDALTNTVSGREIARQIVRSGMSVSANYRAARRARSKREFAAKIGIVHEEADETTHWLELIMDSGLLPQERLAEIHQEATELTKIFARTRKTARASANHQITKSPNHQTSQDRPT